MVIPSLLHKSARKTLLFPAADQRVDSTDGNVRCKEPAGRPSEVLLQGRRMNILSIRVGPVSPGSVYKAIARDATIPNLGATPPTRLLRRRISKNPNSPSLLIGTTVRNWAIADSSVRKSPPPSVPSTSEPEIHRIFPVRPRFGANTI